jgi:hypothetical protein
MLRRNGFALQYEPEVAARCLLVQVLKQLPHIIGFSLATSATAAAAANTAAVQLGVRVALDLASWEVLQSHWGTLHEALLTGCVDLCFCNQVCQQGLLQRIV